MDRLLRTPAIADMLGVPGKSLDNLRRHGAPIFTRPGLGRVAWADELAAWVNEGRDDAPTQGQAQEQARAHADPAPCDHSINPDYVELSARRQARRRA